MRRECRCATTGMFWGTFLSGAPHAILNPRCLPGTAEAATAPVAPEISDGVNRAAAALTTPQEDSRTPDSRKFIFSRNACWGGTVGPCSHGLCSDHC